MQQVRSIEGKLDAHNVRVGVVVARFNAFVTERLVEGAIDCLVRHGAEPDHITIVRVPGSWEIPLVVQKMAAGGTYDGIVALGAVIRGDTPHFDYVAAEVSKGVASVGLQTGVPVSFGVLTTNTVEQAVERAGTKAGNKGWDAALSVLEMIDLLSRMG